MSTYSQFLLSPPPPGHVSDGVSPHREHPPHAGGPVLLQALVVEAVDLRGGPALVVAAKDGDAARVAHLREREREMQGSDDAIITWQLKKKTLVAAVLKVSGKF